MEYFASDPRVLARINKHYKTGESLPLHVIEKLCATKKIYAALELQAQLVFSAADQVCCLFSILLYNVQLYVQVFFSILIYSIYINMDRTSCTYSINYFIYFFV